MSKSMRTCAGIALVAALATIAFADTSVEISEDGWQAATLTPQATGQVIVSDRTVPYGTMPDWQNDLRRQVGGLQVADMNGDGWNDVVAVCYISSSYPPYDNWQNMIYYNIGGTLEASPSWISSDEVSSTDVQIGDINLDGYPDIFCTNGGTDECVIYFGSATGPATSPGWTSNHPNNAFSIGGALFDVDNDGDLDAFTANQGFTQYDPYRPMYGFLNNNGTLAATPYWQSAESGIANFLAVGDYDQDGFDDLAVSKWANFQSGVYHNERGTLENVPAWTVGDGDTDKGIVWADLDDNGWPDLLIGRDPTTAYYNDMGTLTAGWFSTESYFGPSDMRVCDVDRDGDMDFADIHFSNGHARIYLNQGTSLETNPSWVYDSPHVGTALAFGDINGDCWPDLVVGNSGDPSLMVFFANPAWDTADMNCDGTVSAADIDGFVLALTGGQAGYEAQYPNCHYRAADVNCDGVVSAADIDGFVALLVGG
jgi:hypothetical protein